jgi:hypothetical protein
LSDAYLKSLADEEESSRLADLNPAIQANNAESTQNVEQLSSEESTKVDIKDDRANYVESSLRPSEKRKVQPHRSR